METEITAQETTKAEIEDKKLTDAFYPTEKKDETPAPVVEAKAEEKPEVKTTDVEKSVETVESKLKLPEGSELSEKDLKEFSEFAKENKLSEETAQKLLDQKSQQVSALKESQRVAYEAEVEGWKNAVMADKEIGGQNFQQAVAYSKMAVDKFGSDEFKRAVNVSGLGNHPELVRTFARIGKAMADDTLVAAPKNQSQEVPLEDVFYGSKN